MRFEEIWGPATVVATRDVAPRIREILIRPDQFSSATFPVGSHIKVGVSIDGRPDVRSYSLVGEAASAGFRIAVRLAEDSRGGSRYMWSLREGARLNVTAPASLFAIDWQRRNYCLVAGGIGITPLFGAAQALQRREACFMLHYAVRSRRDAAYLDDSKPCSVTVSGSTPATRASASISQRRFRRCRRRRSRCSAARCGCWKRREAPGPRAAVHRPTFPMKHSDRVAALPRSRSVCV